MQSTKWNPISEAHNQNKNSYSKNPTGQKITGVFFPEYMEKKVDFGIRVRLQPRKYPRVLLHLLQHHMDSAFHF